MRSIQLDGCSSSRSRDRKDRSDHHEEDTDMYVVTTVRLLMVSGHQTPSMKLQKLHNLFEFALYYCF